MTTDLSKNAEHLRSIHFKLVALCLILLAALSFKDKEIENSIIELEKIKEVTQGKKIGSIINKLYFNDEKITAPYTNNISDKIFNNNEIYLLEFFLEKDKQVNSFHKIYIRFYQHPIKIPRFYGGWDVLERYLLSYNTSFKKVKDFKDFWNNLEYINHLFIPKLNDSFYESEYGIYKSPEFESIYKIATFYTKISKISEETKIPASEIHLIQTGPIDILDPGWALEKKARNPDKMLYLTKNFYSIPNNTNWNFLNDTLVSKQEFFKINNSNWYKLSNKFIEIFSKEIHKSELIKTDRKIENKLQLYNMDMNDDMKIYTDYFDILWNPRDILKDEYPKKTKLKFEEAFASLDKLIHQFPEISIDDAITLLNRDKKLLGEKFEVFGVKFSSDTLSVWGVLLLLGIQLYFLLHLYDFVKKNTNSNDSWNVAWIANYNNIYSKSTTIISACIIPVCVVITLRYLEVVDIKTVDKNLYILIFLSLISISLAGLTGKSFIKMWKQISE